MKRSSRRRSPTPPTHRAALPPAEYAAFRAKLAEAAGWRCENPLCKRAKPPHDVHHVIPRSQGGPDTRENTVFLCAPCHRAAEDGRLGIEPDQARDPPFRFSDQRPRKTGW